MYNNWKLFKTNNTYHSELVSMCGEVISESEFLYYLENYGEVQTLDKSSILNILSDGCVAGEYLEHSIHEMKKIDHLNEIIQGIENNQEIPFPIFESYKGDISCLDGRHRLLICMKMNIDPKIMVIDLIPSNEDSEEKIIEFREKYLKSFNKKDY